MKTTILEEKLLEIEAKKTFHNDEDMVKAIEGILKKEYRKRESKQNSILINECLDTLLIMKGYDIDKLNRYIESTQQETLDILHERIRLEEEKAKTKTHVKPRRYRPALVGVCIVVTLALMSVVGYAMGFEPLKHIIHDVLKIPVGDSITEGNHEYVHRDETVYFDSVEEVIEETQLTILYPSYLPQGITLNKVGHRIKVINSSTFTFEFSIYALTYIIDTYEVFDHSTLEGQIPTYESNNIVYYVLDEQSMYTVYFEHENIQYRLQYNNYEELIKIINSIEEYK